MSVPGANWSEISVAPRMVRLRMRWTPRTVVSACSRGRVTVVRKTSGGASPTLRDDDDAGELDLGVDAARHRPRGGEAQRRRGRRSRARPRRRTGAGARSPSLLLVLLVVALLALALVAPGLALGLDDGRLLVEAEHVVDGDLLPVLQPVGDLDPLRVAVPDGDRADLDLLPLADRRSPPRRRPPRAARTRGAPCTPSRLPSRIVALPKAPIGGGERGRRPSSSSPFFSSSVVRGARARPTPDADGAEARRRCPARARAQ